MAQACHCAFSFSQKYPELTKFWIEFSNYICILEVNDEAALNNILERARNKNIKFATFIEPDYNNSLTAIALEPGKESKKVCSNLKLALKE